LLAQLGAQPVENRIEDNLDGRDNVDLAPHGPARSRKRRILLAEDNPINALLASSLLDKAGCVTTVVTDGRQAVEAVRGSLADGVPRYDVILMDVHMPELDGLEASRQIRRLEAAGTPVPPIIALTANAFAEDRARCLAAGMSDYLAKPFERAELQRVLDRWCAGDGTVSRSAA
jgi:CheY-like chemotaxis protein